MITLNYKKAQSEINFRKKPTRTYGTDLRVAKTKEGKSYRISIGAVTNEAIIAKGGIWYFDLLTIQGTKIFGYVLQRTPTKWQMRTYNKGVGCFENMEIGTKVCELMNDKGAYECVMHCSANMSTDDDCLIFLSTDNLL